MRRISLALALLGAAAAGCGGGKTSDQGGARGVAEGTFTITIQNGQGQIRNAAGVLPLEMLHGSVTSAPTGINCAAGSLTGCSAEFVNTASVVLTAAPVGTIVTDPGDPTAVPPVLPTTVPAVFLGWAGDCQTVVRADGTIDPTCTLSGKADKYVLARFGKASDAGYHGNWSAPTAHGPQYVNVLAAQDAGTLGQLTWNCFACHGSALQGSATATSCQVCHSTGMKGVGMHETMVAGHASTGCGRCHTGGGFRDYIGADGSADNHLAGYIASPGPGVQNAQAIDAVPLAVKIGCDACHNAVTALGAFGGTPGTLNSIRFPRETGDGVTVTTNGVVAICGQCHTGVRDGRNIAQIGIKIAGVATVDTQLAAANNGSVRPHYLSAASTLLGADAGVYSQYAGAIYTGRNDHGGLGACSNCHDPHTGALPPDSLIGSKCGSCHFNEAGASVQSFLELEETRQFGFEGDIDGDGNALEPLKDEVSGLLARLYTALQSYSTTVGGANMCVSFGSSGLADQPYVQVNTTDACGTGANNVAYNRFTTRSLRASFNYMAIVNDPGAWAHNPRYAIEIIYDSIADLNQGLGLGGATAFAANGFRSFDGHFGGAPKGYATMLYHGATNAFTSELIPQMGFTSGACYQCHGGKAGFAFYLTNPNAPAWPFTDAGITGTPAATSSPYRAYWADNVQCSTCHALDGIDMRGLRSDVAAVNFPPQKAAAPTGLPATGVVSFPSANLPTSFAVCGTCHSGRENGQSITNKTTFASAVTALVTNGVSFSATPVDAYGRNAFKGATVTFSSGGTAAVTGGAAGWLPTGATPTLTWAATAAPSPLPAVGDTFTVTFSDANFAIGAVNPHYLGAAGMIMGGSAKMMFQYGADANYTTTPAFWSAANNGNAPGPHGSPHGAQCAGCHRPKVTKHEFGISEADMTVDDPATTTVNEAGYCGGCHRQVSYGDFRLLPKKEEYDLAKGEVLAAMQGYVTTNLTAIKAAVCAANTLDAACSAPATATTSCNAACQQTKLDRANAMTNVCYNGASHPYWYVANGATCTPLGFAQFNPKLLKASFNYLWTEKEPGAWAHNEFYALQVMYDTIVDLGSTPTFGVNASSTAGSPLNRPDLVP